MDDLTCPLCLHLLFSPLVTTCGHSFCKPCIEKCFLSSHKCPICQCPQPPALTPNYIVQSFIEKNYPEEYQKRRNECPQRPQAVSPSSSLPVFFTSNFTLHPGTMFQQPITEHKYIEMFHRISQGDRCFAYMSKIADTWVAAMAVILRIITIPGGILLECHCKERMKKVQFVRRAMEPCYHLRVAEIGAAQIEDESVWLVEREFIRDKSEPVDKELEQRLVEFTQECISRLGWSEYQHLSFNPNLGVKPSFWMMKTLQLSDSEYFAAYHTDSELERLRIIEKHVRGKKPSRAMVEIKQDRMKFKKEYIFLAIMITSLIIIILSRWVNKNIKT
jgi:hypothetical protein